MKMPALAIGVKILFFDYPGVQRRENQKAQRKKVAAKSAARRETPNIFFTIKELRQLRLNETQFLNGKKQKTPNSHLRF